MSESLSLKWGTIKAWDLETDRSKELINQWANLGHCLSAAAHRDTPEQKKIICDLIDNLDCETVYLDWDGKDVSKDEAKRYVMEYGKP